MVDLRGTRRWRRSSRAKPRRLWAILATVVAIGALLALATLFRPDSRRTVATGLDVDAGSSSARAIEIRSSTALRRPTYDYSVIPGGVWDEQQLTDSVQRDPVVALHYRDVDTDTMRPEELRSDLLAHVSYRVGDRVYWTKRKVRIRSGETILTNGQTQIRARCGNCISLAPLLPTSEDEPDESQLDALTDIGPVLVSWNWTPFGTPLAAGALGTEDDGSAGLVDPSQGLPPLPFGASVFPRGPVSGVPSGPQLPVDSPSSGGLRDSPPGGGTNPPFGGNPPFGDNPPFGGNPPFGDNPPFGGNPPFGDNPPFGGNPPFEGNPPFGGGPPAGDPPVGGPPSFDDPTGPPGNGSTPPTISTTLVPNATPVPEPATLLLLGSGIAGLFARRHWRSGKN